MRLRWNLLLVVTAILFAPVASATILDFQFSGTLPNQSTEVVTGSFKLDTNDLDSASFQFAPSSTGTLYLTYMLLEGGVFDFDLDLLGIGQFDAMTNSQIEVNNIVDTFFNFDLLPSGYFSIQDFPGRGLTFSEFMQSTDPIVDYFFLDTVDQYTNRATWFYQDLNTTLFGELRMTVSKVPEPSTLALMGAGLAGLGFAGRKKLLSKAA